MFGYCLNKRGCSIPSELMAGLGANFQGATSSLEHGKRAALPINYITLLILSKQ